MKSFEEIYQELQQDENHELTYLWHKIKQERKDLLNKVISTSVLVDILLLILSIKACALSDGKIDKYARAMLKSGDTLTALTEIITP